MRKTTLASLATLLLTASGASANPWANYDWATNSYVSQQPGMAETYRAPAYPSERQVLQTSPTAFQQPANQHGNGSYENALFGQYTAGAKAYGEPEAVDQNGIQPVSCPSGNCQSQSYSMAPMMASPSPQMSYGHPPQMGYASGCYSNGACGNGACGGYADVNPMYVNNCYDTTCNTCYAAPARTYAINVRKEALFLNRIDNFNDAGVILDGPTPWTVNDAFGDDEATAWRIGADILFGDPCADWQHGVGFVYGDYGSYETSQSGELPLGIAFDASTKNVPGFVNTSCFFLDQSTFFSSVARAASSNGEFTNEQEELEGLGPDPLPGSGSETFDLPTYRADYRSDLDTIGVDFVLARKSKRLRFGVGWRQWTLNESSLVGITGPLHATDLAFANGLGRAPGAINNGIEHQAFVYNGFGNGADAGFTYIGPPGAEDGIDAQEVDPITGAAIDNNGATDGVGPDTIELLSAHQAANRLNGINFSVAGQVFSQGRFDVLGTMNLGVYHNQASGAVAERVTELTGNGSAYGRGFTDNQDVVSFIGSAGLEGGYWVTDWARLFAGYEVMFINGVALAPEQESGLGNSDYMLQHDGDLILHGAKAGVEFLY